MPSSRARARARAKTATAGAAAAAAALTMLTAALAAVLLAVPNPTPSLAATVVMVHGLGGFGPTELGGMYYWGWTRLWPDRNYTRVVEDGGRNDVYYAVIGKISSHWDRACELYAQIKGVRTDYGYWHAKANQHARWGPDYTGLGFVPDWSEHHKISLVGHSMGPMTVHTLLNMLRNGEASERDQPYPAGEPPLSPLFQGGHNWVRSTHGISGVYNGSPFATSVGPRLVSVLANLLTFVAQIEQVSPSLSQTYNLMLDQYAIPAQVPGETAAQYLQRVGQSDLDTYFSEHYLDSALWDLTPQGCARLNARFNRTYPDVFFFTHAGYKSEASTVTLALQWPWWAIRTVSTSPNTCDNGGLLCSAADEWCQMNAPPTPTPFCYDATWELSDGLVPLRSSQSPEIGVPAGQYALPLARNNSFNAWRPGVWYTLPHERDHVNEMGLDFKDGRVGAWPWGYQAYEDPTDYLYTQINEEIRYVDAYFKTVEAGKTWAFPPTTAESPPSLYPTLAAETIPPSVPTAMPTGVPTLRLEDYASRVPSVALGPSAPPAPTTRNASAATSAPSTASALSTGAASPAALSDSQAVGVGLGTVAGLAALGMAWVVARHRRPPELGDLEGGVAGAGGGSSGAAAGAGAVVAPPSPPPPPPFRSGGGAPPSMAVAAAMAGGAGAGAAALPMLMPMLGATHANNPAFAGAWPGPAALQPVSGLAPSPSRAPSTASSARGPPRRVEPDVEEEADSGPEV